MIMLGDNNKKVIPSLISLLILLISLSRSECGQIRCMEKERQALLLFKEGAALTDENGILSSWHADDCCEWNGVRCSNRTSHVIALDLSFGLRGKIGTSLLELQHLTYLDMSFYDNIGSPIPKFIGSLIKLKYLNLSNCYFSGAIPDQFGNLSNLRTLDLSFNHYLDVKNFKWLSHVSSLRRLDLSKANDWPQAINRLPFLTELKLDSCGLTQILATHFPLFNSSISISILDLSNNPFDIKLSRCQWLFNFSSLTTISLSGTGLLGPIPDDFGKMKSLEYLNLFQNELEGSITNCFSNISSLRLLDLSDNHLNGSIPPSFVKLQRLEVLRLGNNQFQGAFPDFLQPIPLRELHLNGNKLDGTIPPSIGNFSEIEYLDLSSNHFSGLISEAYLINLSKLRTLRISYNSLNLKFNSDWIPPFNLTEIWFTNCKIGPHFPYWLQSQKYIHYIDILGSGIVDTIPNWFGNFSSQLSYVNMPKNHIHGILPHMSFNLETAWVDFISNNIEGLIPKFPSNIVYLSLSTSLRVQLCPFAIRHLL